MGHMLSEYWAKGPDLLNNILTVLLRYKEYEVAFIGDIKKMYHTAATNVLDQHTLRFLWRGMETTREPDIYVIQRVSFGDKPSDLECIVVNNKCIAVTNGFKLCSSISCVFEIYSKNTAVMMSKNSTKLQFHRKEMFTRWSSSTFVVSHERSISDSFVL